MIRLHALVEGQTEETFFNEVIRPHLAERGVFADVQLINPKMGSNARRTKGGWTSYAAIQGHLQRWMAEDGSRDVRFTSMVDLYRIPPDFPGLETARSIADPWNRVEHLERAWDAHVRGGSFPRFIPYIQLHEFEALVLTDPTQLARDFLNRADAVQRLVDLVSEYDSPELIDGGAETAPSKRIIREVPEYRSRKVNAGPAIAARIGLHRLRERCRHFDGWITRLETLAGAGSGG